jgi:formate hydrogenlyase subunit 6/NADH:ubiquinone oxidoreductase subunit I
MSKTLFKSIVHGPYTELYPIKKKESFERTRGSINNNIDDCIFCGICEKRCPTGAIKVEKAKTSWSIERQQCIQCAYCTEVCPKKCLKMENKYTEPSYKKSRDEYARIPDNKENN